MKFLGVISLVCLLAVSPVWAQSETEGDAVPDTETPAEEVLEPEAPYDTKLLRLAEVLGSIHYLRNLCQAGEGNKWRDVMSALLTSENPGPKRKARLISRFNRGYRAFDETYTRCTQTAVDAATRYVQEGVDLTTQINSRYGR